MPPYFDRLADDLWDGNLSTIQNLMTIRDRERIALEATILSKYGNSLSLRGTPAQEQAAIGAAKSAALSPYQKRVSF